MGVQEISELSYNRQPPLPSIVSLQPVVLDRAADQKAGKLGANNVIGSDSAIGSLSDGVAAYADDINTALDQLECTYQPVHQQQHAAFEQLEALALARVRSQEPKPRPTALAPAPAPSRPLAAPAVPLEPRVQSGPLRGPLLLSVANMQDTEQRVQQVHRHRQADCSPDVGSCSSLRCAHRATRLPGPCSGTTRTFGEGARLRVD